MVLLINMQHWYLVASKKVMPGYASKPAEWPSPYYLQHAHNPVN